MLTPSAFEYLQDLVVQHSGIVITADKEYLAEARLASIVAEEGFGSVNALVRFLRSHPWGDLHRKVVESMTTTETSFFRDLRPFNALRDQIVPELIEERSEYKTLRICSAACSSGQEAYSIAMILCEYFPEVVSSWNVQIVAIDLNRSMLERARKGAYSSLEVNRGLPARLLTRYFSRDGLLWQVCQELRSLIEFRSMNLTGSEFTDRFDVALLRNVLMYFDPETKQEVLARVHRAMPAGGALFIGSTETILFNDLYERQWYEQTPYYRTRAPRRAPHGYQRT